MRAPLRLRMTSIRIEFGLATPQTATLDSQTTETPTLGSYTKGTTYDIVLALRLPGATVGYYLNLLC